MKHNSFIFICNNIQQTYLISGYTDEQNNKNENEDEISNPKLSNQSSTSTNKSKYFCLISDLEAFYKDF